jgi:hypothetical protein
MQSKVIQRTPPPPPCTMANGPPRHIWHMGVELMMLNTNSLTNMLIMHNYGSLVFQSPYVLRQPITMGSQACTTCADCAHSNTLHTIALNLHRHAFLL